MSYKDKMPTKVDVNTLSDKEKQLLTDSKYFCMLPWTHLHAYPDGNAYPCCLAKHEHPIGSMKENTIQELWNSDDMKTIRTNMLSNKPSKQCTKCYDQEKSGFFSLRLSSNKHFGHNIGMVENTQADGSTEDRKSTRLNSSH